MSGKISLILILSFSTIFTFYGLRMLESKNSSANNFYFYYNKSQANYFAISGINLALTNINKISSSWEPSNPTYIGNAKVYINLTFPSVGILRIRSIADFNGITDTVIVIAKQKSFSSYGNYYQQFNNVWAATADTFDGAFHTNDYVQCYGNPVFLGKVTTAKGIKLWDNKSFPEFHQGWKLESADPVQFDTSAMRLAAYSNGKVFTDTTKNNRDTNLKLTFLSDGNVKYQWKIGTGGWSPEVTTALSSLSPNGLIMVQKGNVYVQGNLNGQATIVATHKGSSSAGIVYIEKSITYAENPNINPNSDDFLGIVAERRVEIPFDNSRGDIDIHASIFSVAGGITVANYQNYSSAYKMNILGSVTGLRLEPTAKYVYNTALKRYVPTNGYSYIQKYDRRFDLQAPPFFPKLKVFTPLSWYQGQVIIPNFE